MRASCLAIAFSCRKLYREVVPLYYSRNWFTTTLNHYYRDQDDDELTQARNFGEAIGPQNAECVRKTCLGIPDYIREDDIIEVFRDEPLPYGNPMKCTLNLAGIYQRSAFPNVSTIVLLHREWVARELTKDGRLELISPKRNLYPLKHIDNTQA